MSKELPRWFVSYVPSEPLDDSIGIKMSEFIIVSFEVSRELAGPLVH